LISGRSAIIEINDFNMKQILFIVLSVSVLYACRMEELPKAQLSKNVVFGSEEGLEMYVNSFYDVFPRRNTIFSVPSYYAAWPTVTRYLNPGLFSPDDQGGWSWGTLRNINFFIVNNNDPALSQTVRDNYTGIARFFRAYYYFGMMTTFGDLPWIDKPLDVADPMLTAGRDPRTLIIDKIKEDLDFAIANISNKKNSGASTITSTVAAAFKSRVCLWEGTFRKYHTEVGLQSSADQWLQEAVSAAQYVMDAGYGIYTGSGVENSYHDLFAAKIPISQEVLYAVTFDGGLGIVHDGNHSWISATWSSTPALTKSFMNTYLMLDGTPYTDQAGYATKPFTEEFINRDHRVAQTIFTPGFKRITGGQGIPVPPDFTVGITGYQPRKFMLDDTRSDNVDVSDNNIILFRFAEVLLNYAEAKAELGTFTDDDWSKTVGKLRSRAGITGGLNAKPTSVDTYMQQRYFPDISDPVILEIRRERATELCLEGFDWNDVMRWKAGKLLEKKYDGIYIPQLEVLYDFSDDGKPDVVFSTDPNYVGPQGVFTLFVGPIMSNGAASNYQLDDDGHTLIYLKTEQKVWEDKLYFHPIPALDLVKNPNLGQNPGW